MVDCVSAVDIVKYKSYWEDVYCRVFNGSSHASGPFVNEGWRVVVITGPLMGDEEGATKYLLDFMGQAMEEAVFARNRKMVSDESMGMEGRVSRDTIELMQYGIFDPSDGHVVPKSGDWGLVISPTDDINFLGANDQDLNLFVENTGGYKKYYDDFIDYVGAVPRNEAVDSYVKMVVGRYFPQFV